MRPGRPARPAAKKSTGVEPAAAGYVLAAMNTKSSLVLAAMAASIIFTGCVGTGTNTQRGAVGGAALGAVVGAIIGNNSGHGNGANGAAIGAVAGAIAGGTLGNANDHEQGTIYRSEREATTNVVVAAPRAEVVIVRPAPEAVWVAGYWAYRGRGTYVWVEGHWVRPPERGRTYVAPHWRRERSGYVYVEGYWRG